MRRSGRFRAARHPSRAGRRQAIGGGLAAGGFVDLEAGGAVAFIAAFTLGALAWAVGASALLGFARRWATPRLFRVVVLVCGAAFGYFGIRLLVEPISVLRG